MNEKREPLMEDSPKHKKKSLKKGTPRSEHKHVYETVLLVREFHHGDLGNGMDRVTTSLLPTKVCTICGRIGYPDRDPSFYETTPSSYHPWIFERTLSEKSLKLPRWYVNSYFDKYAEKENT